MSPTLSAAFALLAAAATTPPSTTLTGPYVHENLTVFLVHGPDRLKGRQVIALQEAIRDGKVVVHETGDVSELSIENRSGEEVFVQAGDIVKGGKQDRVLSVDAVLPPKSGKVPVSSFCVESGRWSRRAREAVGEFSESNTALASKSLKMAARRAKDQRRVWKEVSVTQEKLSKKLDVDVTKNASGTSLQLALENDSVKKNVSTYVSKLAPIVSDRKDVVGFMFAINGELNSAEVFASPRLFARQWKKLLSAAAVEAIAEHEPRKPVKPVTKPAAHRFLNKERKKGEDLFENAPQESRAWLHTSYY